MKVIIVCVRLGSYVKHTLQTGKAPASGLDLICAI